MQLHGLLRWSVRRERNRSCQHDAVQDEYVVKHTSSTTRNVILILLHYRLRHCLATTPAPFDALTLTNKNTGDVPGDVSFVLSRKAIGVDCSKDPTSARCFFNGDEANSTDVIIQFEVEVDGNWGPYEYCNPTKTDDPKDGFTCLATLAGIMPPSPGRPSPKPECSCPRMNITIGKENRTSPARGSSMYECYHSRHGGQSQCYPSRHGSMSKSACAANCTNTSAIEFPLPTTAPRRKLLQHHGGGGTGDVKIGM